VSVGIYSTGVALTTAVADAQGKASTPVILPATYTGEHTLAMIGADPKEALRTLTALVTVTAPVEPSSGLAWWVWALIALLVLAVIGIIWAVVAGKKGKLTPWDQSLASQASAAQRFSDGPAIAMSDRSKQPAEAVALWNAELPLIQASEQQISGLVQSAPDENRRSNAQRLLGSAVALREALQNDVQMRANPDAPGQDALLTQSAGVIAQRRQELANVVSTIPGVPGATPAGGSHR
jgi:hypothetical protein